MESIDDFLLDSSFFPWDIDDEEDEEEDEEYDDPNPVAVLKNDEGEK